MLVIIGLYGSLGQFWLFFSFSLQHFVCNLSFFHLFCLFEQSLLKCDWSKTHSRSLSQVQQEPAVIYTSVCVILLSTLPSITKICISYTTPALLFVHFAGTETPGLSSKLSSA